MTGIEMLVRILVLLLFAAFFVLPLVFMLLAPTRQWQDMHDITQPPLQFGSLSNVRQAWDNITNFVPGAIFTWTINSTWYTLASVLLSVAVAIPTGYVLAVLKFKGRKLVMWLTLITMILPMYHHGMIVVTPGFGDPALFGAGSPYGATSVSGPGADKPPTESDLKVARFLGRRVAQVAKALSSVKV